MFRFRPLVLLLAGSLFVAGCGDDSAEMHDEEEANQAIPKEVTISKGETGPEFPDAQLTVISPSAEEVVAADSVMVRVDLKGVELTAPTSGEQSKGMAYSKEGQHIHVIIDDRPYMAMYKTDSFSVGSLEPGAHTLRAFPSRSWHESIKAPKAFVAHTFYVKSKTGEPAIKPGEPLLTYSRPKGDYKGADARKILLDFYIANAELGPDKFKVIASIDGVPKDTLTEWVPYVIEGLTDGAHGVKLKLIGPDGKVVPGIYNAVEQTINLAHEQTAAAPTHDTATMKAGAGTTNPGHQ